MPYLHQRIEEFNKVKKGDNKSNDMKTKDRSSSFVLSAHSIVQSLNCKRTVAAKIPNASPFP